MEAVDVIAMRRVGETWDVGEGHCEWKQSAISSLLCSRMSSRRSNQYDTWRCGVVFPARTTLHLGCMSSVTAAKATGENPQVNWGK